MSLRHASEPARGGRRLGIAGALVLISLVACSPPPRGTSRDPEAAPSATNRERAVESPDDTDRVYELENEGQFPPPDSDVTFEEDQLPPAPEDVLSTPIGQDAEVGETVGERGESFTPIEPSVTLPVERSVEEGVPPREPAVGRRGFRVQLVASADRGEAERVAREARNRLGVAVYVDFEAPFYKLRAGDFEDRGAAHRLRERARRNGYPEAWVVTTEIKLQSGDSGP